MPGPQTSFPRQEKTAGTVAFALVLALTVVSAPSYGQANRGAATTRWQIAWHGGTSTYIGDQEAVRLDQPPFGFHTGAELVHQFSPAIGLGVAAQVVRNPRLDEPDRYRSTLSALFRVTQPGARRLSPYLQTGILYIVGASRGGSGPLAGVGFNVRVAPSFSVFAEANLQLVYPGDVLDDSPTADHFDGLGLVAMGIRVSDLRRFFGRRPVLDILAIRHSPTLEQGSSVQFEADLNLDEPGTTVVWTFGDGETSTGTPVQHTFAKPGIHEIIATASSRSGSAVRYLMIDVSPMPRPVASTVARRDTVALTRRPASPAQQNPERDLRPPDVADERRDPVEAPPQHVPVRSSPPRTAEPLPFSGYTWVVASTVNLSEARNVADSYLRDGLNPLIFPHTTRGVTRYRVTLGQYGNRTLAQRAKTALPERVPADTWLAYVDAQVPVSAVSGLSISNSGPEESEAEPPTPPQTDTAQTARFVWVLASPSTTAAAEALVRRLRAQDVLATIHTTLVDGVTRHRVTVGRYLSRSEAESDRANLPSDLRAGAWLLALDADR